MADFGEAFAQLPRYGLRSRAFGPACESVYEEGTPPSTWAVVLGRPGFGIDNAITQFDPAAPERVVFNKRFACGPNDPGAGWDSYCKGDKRTVSTRGGGCAPAVPPISYRRLRSPRHHRPAPGGGAVIRVDQSRMRAGLGDAFVMEHFTDGGIYRPAGASTRRASSLSATGCAAPELSVSRAAHAPPWPPTRNRPGDTQAMTAGEGHRAR